MKLSISRFESVTVDVVVHARLADHDRFLERALDLRVEDHPTRRRQDQLAVPAVLDRVLQADLPGLEVELDLLLGLEAPDPLDLLLLRELLGRRGREVAARVGQVVDPEHHVLRRRRQGTAVRRREDVVRREHQDPRLRLGLGRERQVDGHLVAVEVGVERVTDERMDLDRLALDEHGLERLDPEAVERRGPVQEHRMLGDHLLEDVPDLGRHRLDVLLRRLDVLDGLPLDEPAHDERLEELERHQLRQTALVQLQVRPRHDHRAARVVDPLAEQVLAEAALLALEHVAERLQRPVARAGDGAAATAVVEERVDGLLQHPLLVVDDDLRSAEIQQSLEPVVPVDHAAVEVVQVRGREAAAVELHHRAELRRDHRHGLEDHPVRLVLRGDEGGDDLEPLDRALALLALGRLDRLAQRERLGLEVEVAEQVADRLRPHPTAEVDAEAVGRAEAVLELAEELLVVLDVLDVELAEALPDLLEAADGVDRGLARVLAAGLDVGVHLANLERPLPDRVEVVLAGALLEAEVVGELAHVRGVAGRIGLREHVAEQAGADGAGLLEVLHVDAGCESGVVALERSSLEEDLQHLVHVLRQGALLRARGLLELGAKRPQRLLDLLRCCRDLLVLAGSQLAVFPRRGRPHELADLLGILGRDLAGELGEDP